MESCGICNASATLFKSILSKLKSQFKGSLGTVSGRDVVSVTTSVKAASVKSNLFKVAFSEEKLILSAFANTDRTPPFKTIPSIRLPVFNFSCFKPTDSTNSSLLSKGHGRICNWSSFKESNVSVGIVSGMTNSPCTFNRIGKERRIRSIWMCMPVASLAYCMACLTAKFWKEGMYKRSDTIIANIVGIDKKIPIRLIHVFIRKQ